MHDKKPLVSVAMATYNGERYLRQQLDSIYQQTYSNLEVVVTDDCSTDNTPTILAEYHQKHGLNYIINQSRLGVAKNFEQAALRCRGDYIAFADQDDIWLPHKIETLVEKICDGLLIHSDAYLINAKGEIFSDSLTKYLRKAIDMATAREYFLNTCVTGCTAMINKKLLMDATPFPRTVYSHDRWLALIAFINGTVKYIDEPLIQYRQHAINEIGATKLSSISWLINLIKKYKTNGTTILRGIQKELGWLCAVETIKNQLTTEEQKVLEELNYYFSSAAEKRFRLKAFKIHLKYFSLFNINKPIFVRIFWLISSLFGMRSSKKRCPEDSCSAS